MKKLNGKHSWRILVAAAAALACAGVATGQQFQYTTIWVPGSMTDNAYGVNDSDIVVGFYVLKGNPSGEQGFMKTGQTVTTINPPGSTSTICFGINNSGEVVGQYLDAESVFHAFLYENGAYTTIDPPGAAYAAATGINNLGQIVGEFSDLAGQHGFILDGTTYQTLDVPGAVETTWAGGINDGGQVTLQWYSSNSKSIYSSVYNGSGYTIVDIPEAFNTYAYAINNKGQIAITWQDENGGTYGTVQVQGPRGGYSYPPVEVPGTDGNTTWCYGLSNKGLIVGRYNKSTGTQLGFAATPGP